MWQSELTRHKFEACQTSNAHGRYVGIGACRILDNSLTKSFCTFIRLYESPQAHDRALKNLNFTPNSPRGTGRTTYGTKNGVGFACNKRSYLFRNTLALWSHTHLRQQQRWTQQYLVEDRLPLTSSEMDPWALFSQVQPPAIFKLSKRARSKASFYRGWWGEKRKSRGQWAKPKIWLVQIVVKPEKPV